MKTKNNFDLISQSVKSFTSAISGEDPQDRHNELETEAYLEDQAQQERMEAKEEKLAGKAWEDTELPDGIHPDCDPDSPGMNIIGDPLTK